MIPPFPLSFLSFCGWRWLQMLEFCNEENIRMKIRFRRFGCLLVMSRISLQQSLNLAAHPMMSTVGIKRKQRTKKDRNAPKKRWDLSHLRFMNINILLTSFFPNNNIWTPTETIVLIKVFMISFLGLIHQLFWFVSTNKWNVKSKKKTRDETKQLCWGHDILQIPVPAEFLPGKRKIDDDRFSWVYWRLAVLTRHHHNPYRKKRFQNLSSRNWTTFPSCTFVANPDMLIKGRCLREKSSACRKKIRSKASSI